MTWIARLLSALSSLASATLTSPPNTRPLRVVTFNIEFGAKGIDKVVALLQKTDADVIALAEVDRKTARAAHVDQLDAIARQLGMHAAFAEHARMPVGSTGVALLSRWPIAHAETHVGAGRLATLDADVRIEGQWVHAVVVHLFPTNPFESRADRARHDELRRNEVDTIVERLATRREPLLVMGDFNDTPGSPTHRRLARTLTDSCGDHTFALTYPASIPVARIDYIFASQHFAVEHCDVISTIASDHRAVAAELRLQQ